MNDPSPNPEPFWRSEPAFRAAVIDATKQATQEVAARNRRRLRVESLLIGAIVALIVAIPTTVILSREQHATLRENSHTNCQFITELANIGKIGLKAEIEQTERFKHESHDRLGLSEHRFDEVIAEQEARERLKAKVTERIARHSCPQT